jgi:hypothetical protein
MADQQQQPAEGPAPVLTRADLLHRPWLVTLKGDRDALRILAQLPRGVCDFVVDRFDGDKFAMWCDAFADQQDPDAVEDLALDRIEIMNGLLRMTLGLSRISIGTVGFGYHAKPISLQAIDYPTGEGPGKRKMRIRAEMGNVITDVVAKTAEALESGQRPRESLAPICDAFNAALHDPEIARAIRFLAKSDGSRSDLYLIFEQMGDTGVIVNNGWASAAECTRFTRSANHPAVGDDVRHAKVRIEPPPNPMSRAESQRFIDRVLRRYLQAGINRTKTADGGS